MKSPEAPARPAVDESSAESRGSFPRDGADFEAHLRLLVEQMPAVLWSTDQELRFTSSLGGGLAGLGLKPNQVIGMSLSEYFANDDPEFTPIAAHRRALRGESSTYDMEWAGRTFHSHIEPLRDHRGVIVGAIGVARDITERKQAEKATQSALSLLAATLESTADGILVVDHEGRIVRFNRKFVEMWRIPESILSARDDDQALAFVLDQLEDPGGFLARVKQLYGQPDAEDNDTLQFKDGRVFERYSRPQKIEGRFVGRVWSFRDVTERKRAEQRIEHQAYHDALTELPNRLLVRDRLEVALAFANRHRQSVGVLFLDLDDFKLVNDTFGHTVGDELLRAVAERLKGCVREGDTVGRLGGDEFTLLLPGLTRAEDAARIAHKVMEAVAEPFALSSSRVDVTTSIGISVFPDDGADIETLLRSADTAMYRAKELGRNTIQVSTPEMAQRVAQRMFLVSRLRQAVQRDELFLHYQPILDCPGRRVVAVEALLRWREADGRILTPVDFISAAEESHLIVPIGEQVLRSACVQAKTWQATVPGLRVAVNFSLRQFHQRDLVGTVERALVEAGLAPELLEVEITETIAMSSVERTTAILQSLRDMGVRISIDDFGTGQTSLGYLRRLPLTAVKVDESFVRDVAVVPEARAVLTAMVAMAHALGLQVIAEGVECEEQLAVLHAMGCDAAQGYLFSEPRPPAALTEVLQGGAGQRCAT